MEPVATRMSFESVYGVVATAEQAAVELALLRTQKRDLLQVCRGAKFAIECGHIVEAHDDLKAILAQMEGPE